MSEIAQLCATDKEIFDILFSRKKSLSDAVLFGLAQDRRAFCSHRLDREAIADYLSVLPHDFSDLESVIDRSEQSGRGERATFVTFVGEIDPEKIRTALQQYVDEGRNVAKLSVPMQVASGLTATLSYTEIDYSKTTLAQRQPREATLVFSVANGQTTVRFPSNERARVFVDGIKKKIESILTEPVIATEIDLSTLRTPELRTKFFTNLISAVTGHRLQTVTNVKVAASGAESTDGDDAATETEVSSEVLAVVKHASLTGENLIATPQFRSLLDAGFFVSSIRWRSIQTAEPRELIQFDASLEDPVKGVGLRYLVRHAPGDSSENAYYKKLDDIRERNVLALLESVARSTLADLVASPIEADGGET